MSEPDRALYLPLPWQQAAWSRLAEARQREQLTHAWLLAGPEGLGKRSFARAFAAALLCQSVDAEGQACGVCAACRMLAAGGHPDAHLLGLDGHLGLAVTESLQADQGLRFWSPPKDSARRDIVIDAARSLGGKLVMAPHLGGARVIVVHPASEMNDATANALLKTIEEPPAQTFLLFLAEFPQALKQTIRSRCQLLRFAPPPSEAALDWLRARHPQADAALLAEAGGAPLKAAAWLAADEPARRARWQRLLGEVAARRSDPLQAAAEFGRDKHEVGALCRYWQEQLLAQLRKGHWSPRHEQFLALLLEGLRRLEDTNAQPLLLLESLLLRWRTLAATPATA